MKSKRARELIENGKFSYDEIQAYVLPESYVEIIVVQAEQEAEEHAVKVLKHTLKHFDMTSVQRGAIGLVFEELLNKGEQSDE